MKYLIVLVLISGLVACGGGSVTPPPTEDTPPSISNLKGNKSLEVGRAVSVIGSNPGQAWHVYDATPAGASITTINDAQKGTVVKVRGTGTKNGYVLGGWENSKEALNRTEKRIKWSMKYSEDFTVFVRVMTENGGRYLMYSNTPHNSAVDNVYVHRGLGASVANGTWQTIERDLDADLHKNEPNNSITAINGFYVRGSGLIDFGGTSSLSDCGKINSISAPTVIQKGQKVTVKLNSKPCDNNIIFSLQEVNTPWTHYEENVEISEDKKEITFTSAQNIPDETLLIYQVYLTPKGKGKGWADRVAVKSQKVIVDNKSWLKRTPIPQTNYNPETWSLGTVYTVNNWEEYQEAFKTVKAGDLVWFPAGTKIEVNSDKSGYGEGFIGIHGTADKKIYLSTDIDNPAVISGGRIPIHFRDDCSYIEISNIKIDRAAERGIQLGLVEREDGVGGDGVAKTIRGTVSHIDIINVELTNIGNAAIAISSAHNINVLGGSIHGTFGALKEAKASEGVYIGDGNYLDKSEEEYGLKLDNHHIVIRGMDIYDRGDEAIDLKSRSREVLIEENHIWNVSRHGEWTPAIAVIWRDYKEQNHQGNYNSNIMIRRNHIHNSGGYGIAMGSGGGNVIESNIIHDGLEGAESGVKNGIEIRQTFQPEYNRLSIRNNTVIRHNSGGGAIKYNTYKHTDYEVSSPSVGPQLFKTGQNLVDGEISTELLGSNSVQHVNINQFIGPTKDAADAHSNGKSPSGTGSGFTLKSNTSIDIAPVISNKDYSGMNLSGTSRIGAINLPTRIPVVEDTTPPIITLKGKNSLSLNVGESYIEPGATATDDVDGDGSLTAGIVIDSSAVDTFTAGSYTVNYTVYDAAGNKATKSRIVRVKTFLTLITEYVEKELTQRDEVFTLQNKHIKEMNNPDKYGAVLITGQAGQNQTIIIEDSKFENTVQPLAIANVDNVIIRRNHFKNIGTALFLNNVKNVTVEYNKIEYFGAYDIYTINAPYRMGWATEAIGVNISELNSLNIGYNLIDRTGDTRPNSHSNAFAGDFINIYMSRMVGNARGKIHHNYIIGSDTHNETTAAGGIVFDQKVSGLDIYNNVLYNTGSYLIGGARSEQITISDNIGYITKEHDYALVPHIHTEYTSEKGQRAASIVIGDFGDGPLPNNITMTNNRLLAEAADKNGNFGWYGITILRSSVATSTASNNNFSLDVLPWQKGEYAGNSVSDPNLNPTKNEVLDLMLGKDRAGLFKTHGSSNKYFNE